MNKIYRLILGFFVCPLGWKGHVPEKFLMETADFITVKRCKRCHRKLGVGHWKGMRQIKPPFSTQEDWDLYCTEKEERIRQTIEL